MTDTLFRKVMTKDRNPDKKGEYDTNVGLLLFDKNPDEWLDGNAVGMFHTKYWLEPITLPTDEEIEKIVEKIYPNWIDSWAGSVRRCAAIKAFKEALSILTEKK